MSRLDMPIRVYFDEENDFVIIKNLFTVETPGSFDNNDHAG